MSLLNLFRREKKSIVCCPNCGEPLVEGVCVLCGRTPFMVTHTSSEPRVLCNRKMKVDGVDFSAFFQAMDGFGPSPHEDLLVESADLLFSAEETIRKMIPRQIYLREGDLYAHLLGIERTMSEIAGRLGLDSAYNFYRNPAPALCGSEYHQYLGEKHV